MEAETDTIAVGEKKEFTISSGRLKMCSFTPDKDGYYLIKNTSANAAEEFYIQMHLDEKSCSYYTGTASYYGYLEAEKTYTIQFIHYSGNEKTLQLSVEYAENKEARISVGNWLAIFAESEGHLNDYESERAYSEVEDIATGKYDHRLGRGGHSISM